MLREVFVERLIGDGFHDEPQPSGVDAVLPPFARLGHEGRVEAFPQPCERSRGAREVVPLLEIHIREPVRQP
jgi:hypothetical protein